MAEETVQQTKRPRGRPRKVKDKDQSGVEKKVKTVRRLRKPKVSPAKTTPPSTPQTATPLQYIFAVGRRKRAIARIFLYRDGKGEIIVNNRPYEQYFATESLRQTASEVIKQSPVKTSVRIAAKVYGGGSTGQAEAVRLGIARALLKMDESLRLTLRARGYLTRDPREKERKKPGLKRARRAPQWQKR